MTPDVNVLLAAAGAIRQCRTLTAIHFAMRLGAKVNLLR